MTALRAGELIRRLQIQKPVELRDSFGAPLLQWVDVASVWADIAPLTGRELEAAQALVSEVSHQITIRYQAGLANTKRLAGYRCLYQSRIFNVHAVLNEDERNIRLTLLASEGLNDG